jgi:hypothetical protein
MERIPPPEFRLKAASNLAFRLEIGLETPISQQMVNHDVTGFDETLHEQRAHPWKRPRKGVSQARTCCVFGLKITGAYGC